MKASNGLVLTIFEGQLDTTQLDLSKINAFINIVHGSITLSSKIIATTDSVVKWNQIFYLEKQAEQIELFLYHKPLILKEVHLGTCTLPLSYQSGWVHIFKEKQKVGSLKLTLTNEFLPLDSVDIQELYHKRLLEVQNLKNKAVEYRLSYKQEKKEYLKSKPSNKLHDLISTLKSEQENYLQALNEVNAKKNYLKEQEEFVLHEKEQIRIERAALAQTESEMKKTTFLLQNDVEELQQIRNKLSLQERIFKGAHRNTKSEGRSSTGVPASPYSRAKSKEVSPYSLSSFVL